MSNEVVYVHPGSVSFLGWFVKFFLWLSGDKPKLTKELRNPPGEPGAPIPERFSEEFTISVTQVKGRNVHTLAPKSGTSGQIVFYIHGGAYILNITSAHWNLIGDLIRQTKATFVVPDYPKAPGATAPVGLAMVEQAYQDLIATVPAQNITIMGDSSGGGLSLALAQKLHADGGAQPRQLVLLSPFLDGSMSNNGYGPIEGKDPSLSLEIGQMAGKLWAGDLDTKDPRVSPIYGSMDGLGRVSVFAGGCEIFVADCRKFKELMAQHGTPVNYYEYPTMFHVWMAATFLPEAKATIAQIAGLVKDHATDAR